MLGNVSRLVLLRGGVCKLQLVLSVCSVHLGDVGKAGRVEAVAYMQRSEGDTLRRWNRVCRTPVFGYVW